MENPEKGETLIPIKPETSFQKLLFARKFIEFQQQIIRDKDVEIGKLKAFITELQHLPTLTKEESKEIREKEVVQQHKDRATTYMRITRKLRVRVSDLVTENIQLKTAINKMKKKITDEE